jgi:hypothetical protein
MFRDCPHRGEKGRIVHNVQEDEIVEDMGRNVPKIYVALDNKQVEYQSHMVEVEGMINNQTIAILIDSGVSHSYIDPKMVESLDLLRSMKNLGWCSELQEPKEKLMRWLSHAVWT